jgi:thiol:disulfide interchange protein
MPRASADTTRAQPRWLQVAVPLLLVARVASAVYENHHPSLPNSLMAWVPLAQARVLSRERNIPILYDFTAEWCEPCHELERQVFNDADAARLINASYIPVRLVDRMNEEGENPPEVDALQREFKVTGFPTLAFALPDQKKPSTLSGYQGYSETLEFLLLPSPRGFIPKKKTPAPPPPPEPAPQAP